MKKNVFAKMAAKICATVMAATMCFTATGCGGGGNSGSDKDSNQTVNTDKVQINVLYFNRGFGGEYVRELGGRFEELYKDVKIGDKTGVQVMYYPTTDENLFKNGQIFKQKTDFDVAFTENTYLDQLIAGDALLDIADVVTTKSKYDNKTIAEKMTDQQKNYVTRGNSVYAVPHYASSYGIVYNMSLFDENNWYFKDGYSLPSGYDSNGAICDYNEYLNTNVNGMFVSSPLDKKSAGPDGEFDTEDDGLPCTYDEFFWLCKKIVQSNATPVSWTGKYYDDYLGKFLKSLVADAEGIDNYLNNFDPIGKTVGDLIEVAANGNVTVLPEKTLTSADAADIRKQKGLYDGLRFLNVLINGVQFHADDSAFSTSHEHTDNQEDFVLSYADASEKDIAMIIDGAWWEREATNNGTFEAVEGEFGATYSHDKMKFGWMPLPKVSKNAYETSKQSYCADSLNAFVVARKGVDADKVEIVKDFIRYACADESLEQFTVVTGALKALNYTIGTKNYNSLSNFGRAYYDVMRGEATKSTTNPTFVYTYSSSALYVSNPAYFYIDYYKVNASTGVAMRLHDLGANTFDYVNGKKAFDAVYDYAKTMMNGKV